MRLLSALLASTLAVSPAAAGVAQLLPAGDFQARDGRPGPGKTWRVDDAQGAQLASAMNAVAARTPIVIDYDHQTLHTAKNGAKAPAAGWMHAVEWRRGEGLYAKVEWTPAAAAHIDAGEYRYISPVILFDEDTGAVTHVAMASLVNLPALVGMEPVVAALAAFHADPQETAHMATLLASLIAALGLPAETTEATALTAVTALKARADASPKTVLSAALTTALGLADGADEAAALGAVQALKTPAATTVALVTDLQAKVATLTAQLEGDKVAKTVDQAIADGKLTTAQRDQYIALGTRDCTMLQAIVAAAPVIPGLAGQTAGKQLPGGSASPAASTALAAEVMGAFGLTQEQFDKGAPAKA